MKELLTLNNKLNYSFAALFKFIGANLWKLIIWTFCIFLLPAYTLIGVVIFLLLADLCTGIWKAIKIGEAVTAKRIGDTVTKMILYMLGIICAYVVQHFIALDVIKVMLIFTTLISVREFKSIIENIEIITDSQIWRYIVNQITNLLPNNKDIDKNDSNK
jgi:hypothetical protein